MRVGDCVIYKNAKYEVLEIKWGLYCIKPLDAKRKIWVSVDALKRCDF